jgi:hypothetical protein
MLKQDLINSLYEEIVHLDEIAGQLVLTLLVSKVTVLLP